MTSTNFTCAWKPVLAWVCVAGVAMAYVVEPAARVGLAALGIDFTLPSAEEMPLGELVTIIIGLGGIHSYDKLKGNIRKDNNDER